MRCDGGGVRSDRIRSLTISDSTFAENSASSGSGGGIYCSSHASVAIIASMFSQNSARKDGGGVRSAVNLVTMRESTFLANTARKVILAFL